MSTDTRCRPARNPPEPSPSTGSSCAGSRRAEVDVDRFFLDDNEPVMSRRPMLHRALEQPSPTCTGASSTRSSSTCRPGPATSRLAGPAASSRRGRRRHDAAAARAGGRARATLMAPKPNVRCSGGRGHRAARPSASAAERAGRGARRAAARERRARRAAPEAGDAAEPLVESDPTRSLRARYGDGRGDRGHAA